MKLLLINDTYINPNAVAFVQPEPPQMIEGIELAPGRPGWCLIGLIGGQRVHANMPAEVAAGLVNNWLAG